MTSRAAVRAWTQLRRNGNYSLAILPIEDLVRNVEQTVRRFFTAASQSDARAQATELQSLRGTLNDVAQVFAEGDTRGYRDFLALLFERASFANLYERWQQLLAQVTAAAAQGAARDNDAVRRLRREAAAARELLTVPAEYFGSAWSALTPDISEQITTNIGTRQSVLGERRTSTTPAKKKPPRVAVATADPDLAQRQAREKQQQVDDPFPVSETYKESSVPDPGVYVTSQYATTTGQYETSEQELLEMLNTLQALQNSRAPLPTVAEFWMMRHEAGFWIEEFFNVSLASCDFSSPAIFEREQAFRRYILFNLLKLSLAAATQRDRYQGALREPLFDAWQWREYMSTQFPLISMTLFDETPASGAAVALRQANPVPPDAYVLQALRFVEEFFVSAPPPSADDNEPFPLTAALVKQLSETCDLSDSFIACCNGIVDMRPSSFRRLLAMEHKGELDDEIINQFLKPILTNAASSTFTFVSSQLPVIVARDLQRASRWKIDPPIGPSSRMLIPINLNSNHWYLLVVNFARREFQVYDSISPHRYDTNVDLVKSWLQAVSGAPYDDWPVVIMLSETLQPDSVSCGVYTCVFAQMLVENVEDTSILYTDVTFLRSFICEQILQGKTTLISRFDFETVGDNE